jgi:hypothetical protein
MYADTDNLCVSSRVINRVCSGNPKDYTKTVDENFGPFSGQKVSFKNPHFHQ